MNDVLTETKVLTDLRRVRKARLDGTDPCIDELDELLEQLWGLYTTTRRQAINRRISGVPGQWFSENTWHGGKAL